MLPVAVVSIQFVVAVLVVAGSGMTGIVFAGFDGANLIVRSIFQYLGAVLGTEFPDGRLYLAFLIVKTSIGALLGVNPF